MINLVNINDIPNIRCDVSGHFSADQLAQYAMLFYQNNITGKRLLLLSQDDLRAMGINSVGHRIDLHVSQLTVIHNPHAL